MKKATSEKGSKQSNDTRTPKSASLGFRFRSSLLFCRDRSLWLPENCLPPCFLFGFTCCDFPFAFANAAALAPSPPKSTPRLFLNMYTQTKQEKGTIHSHRPALKSIYINNVTPPPIRGVRAHKHSQPTPPASPLLRGGDAALEGVEQLVLGRRVQLPLPHQPLVVLEQLLFFVWV